MDLQKKEASPKILETLSRLKEKGIILCLATGRGPFALPKIKDFTFDAFLTFNGSLCFDSQGIIYQNPLTKEDLHTFIQNAHELGLPLAVATSEKTYASGTDPNLDQYFAFGKMKVNISDKLSEVVENETIYQILIGASKKDYAHLLKNTTSTKITAWWDKAIDVIPASGGKGIGVQKILEHYHLKPSQAAAFGDGNNDLPMLKAVEHSVAMGNASPELKHIAKYICKSVSEDGIYYFCKEQGLI